MCGIAGIISKDGRPPDRSALEAMMAALRHRGPDGDGTYLNDNVGLAHTRLAIIDVEGGDQPLIGPGGGALVGNGEIYNFVELRAAQGGKVAYRSDADFEPTLDPFERQGLAALPSLRGMYALAMHRPAQGDVLLARDPFGIKPLYLFENEALFAFASEPQALFAAGLLAPEVDPLKRLEILHLQYSSGPGTVFRNVRRLMPGASLRLAGGEVVERAGLDAVPGETPDPPADLDAAIEGFDAAFEESVRLHQRADVPYGMFLSGGLDSAALLTMMARLNERPVRTFTCGFDSAEAHDEREAAGRIAEGFAAEHTEVIFTEEDFWALAPAVAGALDEPTTDYAVLPTYKLAALARDSVKVVLSGEGGDEMLAGYGRYRKLLRPRWRGGKRPRTKGLFEGMGILRQESREWADSLDAVRAEAARPGFSPLQAAQATDIHGWLHADLLLKLDRCLMAHGVEGRTPFLDGGFARFAFSLPDKLKIRDNLGKWVLRHWLARYCPAAGAFERKRGFTVPVGAWIASRGDELGPLVARQPVIAELCQRQPVEDLFRAPKGSRAGRAAWSLLFYALWHRHHIDGVRADADVFAALAG
ncbi:MAG: asparagine synthase (glutamine-hydrolyzing) [Alphaproteobacteria bacterium]